MGRLGLQSLVEKARQRIGLYTQTSQLSSGQQDNQRTHVEHSIGGWLKWGFGNTEWLVEFHELSSNTTTIVRTVHRWRTTVGLWQGVDEGL